MTYIAPRTEALARAMCVALDINPDQNIAAEPDAGKTYEHWRIYQFDAAMLIYEHSGGELPERKGKGRG